LHSTIDIPMAMAATGISAVIGVHVASLGGRVLRQVPALATALRRRRP
jgi:hypothetical protein